MGWVIQFIGHLLRGPQTGLRGRPGLLVGPMFVAGEVLFSIGWGRQLLAEIEQRVGPTHIRDLAQPV